MDRIQQLKTMVKDLEVKLRAALLKVGSEEQLCETIARDNARQDELLSNLCEKIRVDLVENQEQKDTITMLNATNQQLIDKIENKETDIENAVKDIGTVGHIGQLIVRVSELEQEVARRGQERDEIEQEVAYLSEIHEELMEVNHHLRKETAMLLSRGK
jgi:chromosome segregation ATPase